MAHIDTKNWASTRRVIHAGGHHDPYGSATVPIYQTSTFAFDSAQQGADRFGRNDRRLHLHASGNPTIPRSRGRWPSSREDSPGIATSSGMGAVSTSTMALLDQGNSHGRYGERLRTVAACSPRNTCRVSA